MSLRLPPALSLTCIAALLSVLPGCPGDDSEVTTEGGTTSDGTTTSVTTMQMTTMQMTTEQATSSSDSSSGLLDTTVGVDDTTTSEGTTSGTTTSEGTTSGTTGEGTTSGTTTGGPEDCGNGVIDMGEDCDSDDVGAVTCLDQGFDDGVMACDNLACTFDTTGCFFVEALQNDNGMCGVSEVGCTDMTGTAGNPQDAVECYQTTLTPPIDVVQVNYAFGDSIPLPLAADLVIFEWAGPGNLPGLMVDQIPLDPLVDIVAGPYDFVLPTPINVATAGFCVGMHGEDPADAFRLEISDAAGTGESYLRADPCLLPAFAELDTLGAVGNYCIRPTVTSPNP